MRKKDILELKKRLKKDDCTFTKMCGCYVNGEKNIILKFNETFLNLDEDEFFKYLEIAKKTLSGTIGNNLLNLEFPFEQEEEGGRQYDLMKLKRSCLKDEALLDEFYNNVIDNYDYEGNFLILLFHDAYDVIIKTTDNSKLDESEEVYEYILCAICPVSLSKPGLSYHPEEDRIGARERDWVVEAPSNGFIFPAFIDRGSDIHSVIYYTKNPKDTHPELVEGTLGCEPVRTAAEQKETFTNIIKNAVGSDDEKSDNLIMEIQDTLNTMIDDHEAINGTEAEPKLLTNNAISDLLVESGVPEEICAKIEQSYTEEFGDTPPVADNLLDSKTLAKNEQRKKEKRLEKQVEILKNKLERTQSAAEASSVENNTDLESPIDETTDEYIDNAMEDEAVSILKTLNNDGNLDESSNALQSDNETSEAASDLDSADNSNNKDNSNYDIVLKVKPEKVEQIKYQIIDGKKYLVIPVDDDEQTNVNGVDRVL
ncbi:DUF4317 domain-containing protein [Clostridium sp. SM-530-WT-3G]|uniref:DUF4317 domain-containing protein n=1 Tax=Clostridium sp. SM-530-WT-3G TaxID=2725303 RepID=UPI00145E1F0F|nr:DUF4317 domain-containing protein [Clostridium sp. SM-530-WT-3G]NME82090.1 DUF4317 domain-containing protein [Clostridium sp. SM-530-WT-3G]